MSPDGVTGTAAPATYKDVPVPPALDGEWNGVCGYWFRRGVDETDAVLRDRIADEIDDRGWELRTSDEGISREEWGCYSESATIAREGLAGVQSQ